jgi:gamma-glutamyltranspeptidase/glutathione hydrolase
VASPHHLASSAGLAVLASGGNALDAAIATNLTLGVVTPYLCGFGGDLFAMIWKDGKLFAYNGSGRAPAGATVDAVRAAVQAERMPALGPHTVTVPGAVEAWFVLLQQFGTRAFADLAQPALRYAEDGFVPSALALASLQRSADRYAWSSEWQAVYGGAQPGRRLRQPDLARTIELLGKEGPDAYYRGRIARAIVEHLRLQGALIAQDDLADHHGEFVEPLRTIYRGVEILELPPNTQGVTALEAVNIVSAFDHLPLNDPERQHLLIEAMKLALADRDAHVTDPDHMRIRPERLLSQEWAAERARLIDLRRAGHPTPGTAVEGGTAYLCAADAEGMCVSLIQSNWTGFGSGVTVPGWGINLQNRGALFSLDPKHANVIAPRKRTLHTLIPGMAFRQGRPWLAFGTMGGNGQAQTHLQLLVRVVDDGMDLQEAIDAPRWLVSPADWSVSAEPRFAETVIDGLRERGHAVETLEPYDSLMGHAHAIAVSEAGYEGATDPRTEGAVLGL